MLFTGPKPTYPEVFFSKIGVSYLSCGPLKRNSWEANWNMAKTRKNKKVNKGPSATWWPNFENVKKQKMDFFIILTTPENMKTVCATLKSQCSIVIFAKIAKNWPNFSFLAIILVPDQKDPNFLDFLDPYTCPDLGQEESQKVWSTLVITLVGTLVPTVFIIINTIVEAIFTTNHMTIKTRFVSEFHATYFTRKIFF